MELRRSVICTSGTVFFENIHRIALTGSSEIAEGQVLFDCHIACCCKSKLRPYRDSPSFTFFHETCRPRLWTTYRHLLLLASTLFERVRYLSISTPSILTILLGDYGNNIPDNRRQSR